MSERVTYPELTRLGLRHTPAHMARIDTHVHLWDPRRFRMPWLDGIDRINQRFTLEEYRTATTEADIEAFVFVEAGVDPAYALQEAHWVAELARHEPRLGGIVAAASLEDGAQARGHLAALAALGPRVKGVRRNLQGEPDPAFCLQPAFLDGVRMLPQFGLSFDLCITHRQLPAIITLVRQCAETSFILDHMAKPAIKSGTLDPWRAHIRQLAALPNVVCKISGLVTEADHERWTTADLAPYVAHVLDQFGEDRVLFGSDWPVALLASSYTRWVETLDALTTPITPAARRKLWSENARRIYRLDEQGHAGHHGQP